MAGKSGKKAFDQAEYFAYIAHMRHDLEFSTGQVARLCLVAPRTVSKWFDSGRLRGHRLPGSEDRRIPREYLIKFLKERGMQRALDLLLDTGAAYTAIYAGCDGQACAEALGTGFALHIARNQAELCIAIGKYKPGSVIIDFTRPGADSPLVLCSALRALPDLAQIAIIGIRDSALPFDPSCVDASVSDVPNFLASEIAAQIKKKTS